MFGSTKKTGQQKTIFSQWKILIKIRLVFYRLFSKFFFLENNLSLMVRSLTLSLFAFSFLTPSLSLTLVSLSLSLCFSSPL